ncbi:uncharacterized protein LOC144122980 [Amblyomma americanum]
MNRQLLPLAAFVVVEVGGYSMNDPTPANKLLILLNTKVQWYNPDNQYPVKGCSWVTPSMTQGVKDINVTLTDGYIRNLVSPGIRQRGWCSSPGWAGNELTVGCYSFFSDVKAEFSVWTSRDYPIISGVTIYGKAKEINVVVELASELGGRPRLSTWLVRPFNLTTHAVPRLQFVGQELASINASSHKCIHDRILEVLQGKYKEDLSKAAGSQDSYIPPP